MKTCYILGASDLGDVKIHPKKDDFVIVADGGYSHLKSLNIKADLVLGDFDSLGYIPKGENVQTHPIEKNDTDMLLAVNSGLERGYEKFVLLGGLGGDRFDHSIANLQTLIYLAEKGCIGYLLGKKQIVTAISNGEFTLPEKKDGNISVFALGECAKGVCIDGLYYTFKGNLKNSYPLGVSNHFCGKSAKISVEDGTLLIIWDEESFI